VKRLLLGCLVFLAACVLPFSNPTDPNGATLTLELGTTFSTLKFNAGNADAQTVKLEIAALGARVNDAKCKLDSGLIRCDLGTVSVGKVYALPITGTAIQARANYARATGLNYEIFLK
jgi:hypothetical protein